MAEANNVFTDDELEDRLDFSFYGGSASAFEDVVSLLTSMSGSLWVSGDVVQAEFLRDKVIPKIKVLGEEMRKKQGLNGK